MKFKRVTFTVRTNTPGWFVDEALFLESDYKHNVIVYGPNILVDDFIKYVEEQDFDVSIDDVEEIDSE